MTDDHPTTLTEAEWAAIWLDIPGDGEFRGVRRAIDKVLAARTPTATGDAVGLTVTRWGHARWFDPHPPVPVNVWVRPDGGTGTNPLMAECSTCHEVLLPVTFAATGDDLRDRVTALADLIATPDLLADVIRDGLTQSRGPNSFGIAVPHQAAEAVREWLGEHLSTVLAASPAPVASRPEAVDERRFRDEWADYFEHWTQAVGPEPLTVETVIAVLRAERQPFGVARAASFATDPEAGGDRG